jgi:rhamnosyltransferase
MIDGMRAVNAHGGQPSTPRICGLIVTYRCGENVKPTFRSVAPQVERVVFIDNGSGDDTPAVLESLRREHGENVEVITLVENRGIAGALNIGMARAMSLGYRWVLTMDHDSVAGEGMVRALLEGRARFARPDNVMVAAPVFVERNMNVEARIYRYGRGFREVLSTRAPCAVVEPEVAITSGNLVDAELYRKVGGFDERLFIDYVDHDFCLRGRMMGFDIVVCADAKLFHTIGRAIPRNLPFGRKWFSSGHSPERRYTMSRNRLWMIRKYWRYFPGYAFWIAVEYPKDVLGIVISETARIEKLKMMLKGFWAARTYFRSGA